MKINKVKNMTQNMFFGICYRVISILFPFILRTIIINVLSAEYLGLSSLFTSILQALNLVEAGIGSALVFNMYKPVAENDIEKIGQYMAFYKKCYRIIGSIILMIGLLILPFLDNMISGTYPKDINLKIVYLIYLGNTVLTYWLFAYKNSLALAYQRTDIESKVLIITQSMLYIFQIVILIILKNYYAYIILMPIATIGKNLMISKKIDRTYPKIKAIGTISIGERKNISSNIRNLFGHQIAFTVINSADNIVLSAVLGLNELAKYNNYYYIFNAIVNMFTIVFSSIQAGIGNSIILDDKEKVFENYKNFRLFIYILVSICSACLFMLYQPFMKIWMGNSMLMNDASVIIFVVGFYITQIRRVVTTYKNAAGMWKDDWLKPYITIVVDIVIDIIIIKRVGAIGAMIATIISMSFVSIPWENYILYKKLFNKKISEQYIFVVKECLITICILGILLIISKNVVIIGIKGIVCYLIIAVGISTIFNIVFNYNSKEMKWILLKIKSILGNFMNKHKILD